MKDDLTVKDLKRILSHTNDDAVVRVCQIQYKTPDDTFPVLETATPAKGAFTDATQVILHA